ncbi:MAG: formate/nitrite transporter family protein [Mycoplasmoidaceae bacterium]|nr:formate/nitrite transporter family protein [Mycoplasmoidaceae bacterium]
MENNGFDKAHYPLVKKIVYGILAGFFVGIGFTSMILMVGNTTDKTLGKFLGGVIFCVGILMCMFIGASLFTANCSIYAPILKKRLKRRFFYYDLLITLIAN